MLKSNECQSELSNKIAGCYNIGRTIGKGHFAVVKEAKHVFTQETVAIKIVDKTKLDNDFKDQLFSEVMCMKLVQHPNIVRLYEVIDTVNKMYLVIELGDGGDLYDYILQYGSNGLNEEDAKHYFRQILRAISYCHKLHVVHRDLKPENVVFFKQTGIVKLTDFGFSNKFTPGETLKTSCGSLAYSAPEILLGDCYDAPKVDIWSLGVILYMLVVGILPFNETNDSETIAKIMDCSYSIPTRISQFCSNLIRKMLIRDSNNRANLDDILVDEWLCLPANSDEFDYENYTIPLITQHHLDLEDHLQILSKMSDGKLATADEIQEILDNEIYNHISATYFLLAERKMKRKFIEEYCELRTNCEKCQKANVNGCLSNIASNVPTSFESTRRISMILEGEEIEEEEEEIDAMASLSAVREELEGFMPHFDGDLRLSGVAPPFPSRCASRINSTNDLCVFMSDEYDSDTGSLIISNKKLRKRSNHKRSVNNSISSQISQDKIDQLAQDYLLISEELEHKTSLLTQIPENITEKALTVKKSFSFTDITRQKRSSLISIDIANNLPLKTSVHKFQRSRSTTHSGSSNPKTVYRHSSIWTNRKNQVIFDTGSPSNCSSTNSDCDDSVPYRNTPRHSKVPLRVKSDGPNYEQAIHCHYHDEREQDNNDEHLIHNNGCIRSKSFDSRYRNAVRPISNATTINTSSSVSNWNRHSISRHFAASNFSLSSLAQNVKSHNMLQLIRSSFELRLHNIASGVVPSDNIVNIVTNYQPNSINNNRLTASSIKANTCYSLPGSSYNINTVKSVSKKRRTSNPSISGSILRRLHKNNSLSLAKKDNHVCCTVS